MTGVLATSDLQAKILLEVMVEEDQNLMLGEIPTVVILFFVSHFVILCANSKFVMPDFDQASHYYML